MAIEHRRCADRRPEELPNSIGPQNAQSQDESQTESIHKDSKMLPTGRQCAQNSESSRQLSKGASPQTGEALPCGSDVNCCWNGIKEALAKSAEKCIPKKNPIRNPWISPTTLELIVKRNRARTIKSKKKISREIKRKVRIDKNRFYESTADDIITADEHGNTRKVYNAVRKLTGTKDPSIDTVKDENGKFTADTNEKIKQWAKHFENLLNRPTANPASLNIRSQSLAQGDTNPPSPEEIMQAIAKLRTNKAAGDDNLPPELFLYGMHELLPHFQDLLLSIWNNEKIPDDWKTAVIVPIHKKGDKANCANYRGISLLNIAFKILEAILKNRIEPAYESVARKNQAGFKAKRGCRDQIFAIRQIVEQRYEFDRQTVLVFIDFKAAFDSVNRETIWRILESHGLPPKLIQVLRAMYTETFSTVSVYNSLSKPFAIVSGVRQGSILAPFYLTLLSTGQCMKPPKSSPSASLSTI